MKLFNKKKPHIVFISDVRLLLNVSRNKQKYNFINVFWINETWKKHGKTIFGLKSTVIFIYIYLKVIFTYRF